MGQPEYIRGQTIRYQCKACDDTNTVDKTLHIHETGLCRGCYDHEQPYLTV